MKKAAFIILGVTLLTSCKKEKCWKCNFKLNGVTPIEATYCHESKAEFKEQHGEEMLQYCDRIK